MVLGFSGRLGEEWRMVRRKTRSSVGRGRRRSREIEQRRGREMEQRRGREMEQRDGAEAGWKGLEGECVR